MNEYQTQHGDTSALTGTHENQTRFVKAAICDVNTFKKIGMQSIR